MTTIISIIYMLGLLFIPKILIEKTKPKNDGYNSIIIQNDYIKYQFIFMMLNFFCFLFLNKIRENRKIDHYKNVIEYLDFYGFENISYNDKLEYIKMSRYIKLKNLK